MRTQIEYAWQEKRIFVENRLRIPIVRKKSGKVIEKVKVPMNVSILFLSGDFVTTRLMRCVPVERGSIVSWSICQLIEPVKPLWAMPVLRVEPKSGASWKRWASMTAAEFSFWLSKVLGPERAAEALGKRSA